MIPKVSIIVPMYNVEKYLDQCVNSLINQTLTDIEIILVDDGSPDLCGKMADEFALNDDRIKVIHQTNSGLGPARNSGMKLATGEYIAFVDSDDWVKKDMYKNLYETAIHKSADIVVGGHCEIKKGVTVLTEIHPLAGKTYTKKDEILNVRKKYYGLLPSDNLGNSFPKSAWRSLYKRSLIKDNNLKFINILSEDTIFNLLVYKFAKVISFTSFTDYCYRKDDHSSITQTFSSNKLAKYEEFLKTLSELARFENDSECVIRAKRMAIEYCRLYVGIVDNANESFKNKKMYVKEFAESKIIKNCWEGYPLKALPPKQMIFHILIEKKCYGVALLMNRIKKSITTKK